MAVPADSKIKSYAMNRQLMVQPVILCGGSGARLWPLSREGFPKQFLCLTGGDTLFQQAAKRLMGLPSLAEVCHIDPRVLPLE